MGRMIDVSGLLLCMVCMCGSAVAQTGAAPRVLAEWPLAELEYARVHELFSFHDMEALDARDNDLTFRLIGDDPYVVGPKTDFGAEEGRQLVVNMTVSAGHRVTVYFMTESAPQFGESKKISFPITADRLPHEYTICPGDHPEWRGTITRLRLDVDGAPTGTELRLHSFRVEQPPARLSIDSFYADTGFITPGRRTGITASIRNSGGRHVTDVEVHLSVPDEIEVLEGETRIDVGGLDIGESRTTSWTVRVPRSGVSVLSVSTRGEPAVSASARLTVAASRPLPGEPPALDGLHVGWTDDNDVSLGSDRLELLALRNRFGYGPAALYLRGGSSARPELVAILPYLARIELADGSVVDVYPFESRLNRGTFEDRPFVQASFAARFDVGDIDVAFSVNETDPWLAATYTFTASQPVALRRFSGPVVLAGERGFGGTKTVALFPGLEYLVANERSSSDQDIRTDYVRLVPDPDKVTIPYMAVQHRRTVVQLMWPRPGTSGAGWSPLSAVFASPNWYHGQQNHLMALFAPGGKGFVAENEVSASEPLELSTGDQVVINAKLAAYETDVRGLGEATRTWFAAYGVPQVPPPPRMIEEAIDLARVAYTETCWDEDERGWFRLLGRKGLDARFYGSAAVALDMISLTTADRETAVRCADIVQRAMADRSAAGYGPALAWRVGGIRETIAALERASERAMEKQQPNGSWVYEGDDKNPALGVPGATAPGVCAAGLGPVLTYAGVTGDPEAVRAALRGLDFISRFTVPRGSQLWEIPIHTPDILAAARVGAAFLAGYRLTGSERYLDEARYWAETGLPFVYLWQDSGRPVLAFATIPVFGATFYRAPGWFGRPVQWCGLAYAHFLAQLAEADYDEVYTKVARGILYSAIHQQHTSGPTAGTYPDVWNLAANRPAGPNLAPGLLVKAAYAVLGYSTELEWTVCRAGTRSVHISSAARIQSAEPDDGRIIVWLRYPAGGTCFTVIAGHGREPAGVVWAGTELDRSDRPEPRPGEWSYDLDTDTLIINSRFTLDEHELRVVY